MKSRSLLSLAFGVLLLAAATAARGEPAATKIDHVDAKGAAKLLAANEKIVVLDVRTPDEYAEGHIKGARLIDFNGAGFAKEVAKLDRDKTYLVHCLSGGRSTSSLKVFKKLGFKHIVHLDGGFMAWEDAKLPVAK